MKVERFLSLLRHLRELEEEVVSARKRIVSDERLEISMRRYIDNLEEFKETNEGLIKELRTQVESLRVENAELKRHLSGGPA